MRLKLQDVQLLNGWRSSAKSTKNAFDRVLHELFPFVAYLKLRRSIRKELDSFAIKALPEDGPTLAAVRRYAVATPENIKEELVIQQKRAADLDDKTFKYATSIATALTIAAAATTAVAQLLSNSILKLAVVMVGVPAIGYVMAGGLLGIAAARTMGGYGTGLEFRLAQDGERPAMRPLVLAVALACQERVNIAKSARNEAAFMCIRNGFILTTIAICVILAGSRSQDKSDTIERKTWNVQLESPHRGKVD
jgi:hypothetical protein